MNILGKRLTVSCEACPPYKFNVGNNRYCVFEKERNASSQIEVRRDDPNECTIINPDDNDYNEVVIQYEGMRVADKLTNI